MLTVKGNKIKNHKIFEALHGQKGEFILQKGITADNYANINPPNTISLFRNLMFDALEEALSFIKQNDKQNKLAKKKVVLYDIDYTSTSYVWLLSKYFSDITVVTENRKKYNKLAKKMLQNNGTPIVVTNYLHNVNDISLIVSPKRDNILEYKHVGAVYIGVKNTSIYSEHKYCDFLSTPIKAICRHIPQDISEYEFLCAVVNEYGYDKNLCTQIHVEYNGEIISDFSNHLNKLLGNNENNS